jgi:hypothetical protein
MQLIFGVAPAFVVTRLGDECPVEPRGVHPKGASAMAPVLEKEWKTYEQQRAHLLEDHAGEFVLIHKREVLGVFGSRHEALKEGYQRLGNVPFLVHKIAAEERPRRLICHTVRGRDGTD